MKSPVRPLILSASFMALLFATGCGGGSSGDSAAQSSVDNRGNHELATEKAVEPSAGAEVSPATPVKTYLFLDGVDAPFRHAAMRQGLAQGGAQVFSFECRIPGEPVRNRDSASKAEPAVIFPGGGGGQGMYYIAEVRYQDIPIARKLGFFSPLPQEVAKSKVVPCPTMS